MKKETVYFRNGKLVAKSGDIRIYNMDDELFLEDGRMNLISSSDKKSGYIWQIGDRPVGNCLVIGLGLGTVARYLLSLNKVTGVTVIEENKDMIEAVNRLGMSADLFEIICTDYLMYLYKHSINYDFIFIDCYTKVDESTLPYIADLAIACKTNLASEGILLGWLDMKTPEKFIDSFYSLFNTE